MSALHIAILTHRDDMVKELLQLGVDWNYTDERYGMTPLHLSHSLGKRGGSVMKSMLGGIAQQCQQHPSQHHSQNFFHPRQQSHSPAALTMVE
jgi:ankyrin repeat protein